MLIDFADVRTSRAFRAGSANASRTRRWQSSKVPRTATEVTLPPRVANWASLPGTDLAEGVKDHDANARLLVECVGHRAARVPRGRREDRDRGSVVVAQGGHHAGHEARAHILEPVGGAVEELEHVDAGLDFAQGDGEVQRVVDHGAEEVVGDLGPEEVLRGQEGPLGEGEPRQRGGVKTVGGRAGQGGRDEEAAIGGLTPGRGLPGRTRCHRWGPCGC